MIAKAFIKNGDYNMNYEMSHTKIFPIERFIGEL